MLPSNGSQMITECCLSTRAKSPHWRAFLEQHVPFNALLVSASLSQLIPFAVSICALSMFASVTCSTMDRASMRQQKSTFSILTSVFWQGAVLWRDACQCLCSLTRRHSFVLHIRCSPHHQSILSHNCCFTFVYFVICRIFFESCST